MTPQIHAPSTPADYLRGDRVDCTYIQYTRPSDTTHCDLIHIAEAEGNLVNIAALISGTASRLPSRAPPKYLPPNKCSGHESIDQVPPRNLFPDYRYAFEI